MDTIGTMQRAKLGEVTPQGSPAKGCILAASAPGQEVPLHLGNTQMHLVMGWPSSFLQEKGSALPSALCTVSTGQQKRGLQGTGAGSVFLSWVCGQDGCCHCLVCWHWGAARQALSVCSVLSTSC